MSDRIIVTLTINGQSRSVAVKPNATLKHILREELGLTGTKSGCEVGDCGACTVVMDGKAVASCIVLAAEADGAAEINCGDGFSKGHAFLCSPY